MRGKRSSTAGRGDKAVRAPTHGRLALEGEFKVAEPTDDADHLGLVVANGYIGKQLRNCRIVGYLA